MTEKDALQRIGSAVGWRSSVGRATRSRLGVSLLFLLAGLCLGSCANLRRDAATRDRSLEPIFSPNGEPLNGGPLGHPACNDAVASWFARVDADHDGTIDRDEFLADTRRQFAVMDLNKDGEITSAELGAYRAPFGATPSFSPAEEPGAPANTAEPGSRRRRGVSTGGLGARKSVDTTNDTPDPVMSADVNLKFRVNLSDFVAYEKKEFSALDLKRNGRVTLGEVQQSSCPGNAKP